MFFGFLVFIRKIYLNLILFLCRLNIWSSGRILRPPKVYGNESKIWIAPKFSLNSSLTDWKRLLVCSCCLIWMDFIVPNCAISYRHCLQTFYCCHIIIFKIKFSTNSRIRLSIHVKIQRFIKCFYYLNKKNESKLCVLQIFTQFIYWFDNSMMIIQINNRIISFCTIIV